MFLVCFTVRSFIACAFDYMYLYLYFPRITLRNSKILRINYIWMYVSMYVRMCVVVDDLLFITFVGDVLLTSIVFYAELSLFSSGARTYLHSTNIQCIPDDGSGCVFFVSSS